MISDGKEFQVIPHFTLSSLRCWSCFTLPLRQTGVSGEAMSALPNVQPRCNRKSLEPLSGSYEPNKSYRINST